MAISDSTFSRHVLPNGLRLVLETDATLPLVALNLSYAVGSKDEDPGRTGLAHLFEHLLFQGSRHVPPGELLHHVQRAGGHANGSTWYDRTSFFCTLPSSHLELGLWLESDRMGFPEPAFTPERFETQRRVVINERRTRFDNRPYGLAYEHLHELLFPEGHPYRSPVIGREADLATITLEDARSFFDRFYTPSNAVLSIVGDIEPERVVEKVALYFGEVPWRPAPHRPVGGEESAPGSKGRRVVRDAVELSRVYLGFRLPGYPTSSWYAADLASAALTRGRASLLARWLVLDRQIAQDVASFVLPTELDAVFVLVATCKPGVAPETVEKALADQLDDLARRPLDPEHHLRCRHRALTGHLRRLQSFAGRADGRSKSTLLLDDPGFVEREIDQYMAVTPGEVTRFVAAHLRSGTASTVVYEGADRG